MSQLVAKSGKSCTVSGARSMGVDTKTGEAFFEVACGSAPGFVIQTDRGGASLPPSTSERRRSSAAAAR